MTTSDASIERVRRAMEITDERELAAFITSDVLEHPAVMHFAEILALENVRALKGTVHGGSVYEALETFAYGTFREYRSRGSGVPTLTEKQEIKLKQLSVCSACGQAETSLSYDKLFTELCISSIRELEDFLIDHCLATAIVRGKLDPKNKCFHIHGAIDRDVPLSQLDEVIASVSRWHDIADSMFESLNSKIKWTADEKAKAMEREDVVKANMEELQKLLKHETEVATPRLELDDMDEDGQSIGAKRRR